MPELGRAPVSGDVFVLDTYSGATRKMDFMSMRSALMPVWASQTLSENGEYIATEMGAEGWSRVTVSVYPPLQEKYVSQNGLVTPDSGYYGLSEVEVSVSNREAEILNGSISAYSDSQITQLRSYAFAYTSIASVSLPSCEAIGTGAFASCDSLTRASFPACSTIGASAFYNCSKLQTASFPSCTIIGSSAFYYCTSLSTAYFPNCSEVRYATFYDCRNLTSIDLPVCTDVATSGFYDCSKMTLINLPSCTSIGNSAFYSCKALSLASIGKCAFIGQSAFRYCYNLVSLYLGGSSVATLSNSNAFTSTPIGGYSTSAGRYGSIYVPASLLSSYKTAANWSYFSSRIFSYSG